MSVTMSSSSSNTTSSSSNTTAMGAFLRSSPHMKSNQARWAQEREEGKKVGSTPPVVSFGDRRVNITRTSVWWGWGLRTIRIKETLPYGWYVLDGEDAFCSQATWDLLRLRPQPRQGDGLRFVSAPEDEFLRDGGDLIGDLERKAHRIATYVIEGFDTYGFVGETHFERDIRRVERKLRKIEKRMAR